MSPLRRAALRFEMAEGRVQAMRTGMAGEIDRLEQATFDLESERNSFRHLLTEATGIDPSTLARLLAL